MVAHFVAVRDETFLKMCASLNFSQAAQKPLNVQLVRVLCADRLDREFRQFDQRERQYLEEHQKSRASLLFSILLRFQKLGDLPQLLGALRKHFDSVFKAPDVSYTQIAKKICEEANVFKIKLFGSEEEERAEGGPEDKLLAKNPQVEEQMRLMTNTYHYYDSHFSLEAAAVAKYQALLEAHFSASEI